MVKSKNKRFTDNDRDQQTYGSDQSGPVKIPERPETDTILYSQCKNDQWRSLSVKRLFLDFTIRTETLRF
jgi:hypothetical protein